jgi:ferredoxin
MKKGNRLVLTAIILLAAAGACISEADNPLLTPNAISANAVIVETGYTQGQPYSGPGSISPYLGEYSAFTLHWSEVADAAYYEIRASEVPITVENWEDAIPMEVIPAPADSGLAFNVIEVLPEPCIGCGLCEAECPNDAITVQGGVAVIDYDRCTSCGLCQDVCPVDAITGTRNGKEYYFGIRAFYGADQPAEEIAVTDGAFSIVFFNSLFAYWQPPAKNCGLCQPGEDSLGCFGGCHIMEDWADEERTVFTGTGCPFDAIWQDTVGAGPRDYMVYIDYDLCQNCGKCFVECWNYNSVIDPTESYLGLRSMMHRVVPAGWVSEQPVRP